MNGLRSGFFGNPEDSVNCKIALRGGRRADAVGFIGVQNMARVDIRLGVDRDGGDSHFLERPQDSAGYGATISDKNFIEHSYPRRGSGRAWDCNRCMDCSTAGNYL